MALNTVTLQWNLEDAGGGGLSGYLKITPTAALTDGTGHAIVPARTLGVPFTGGFGTLPGIVANDNAGIAPSGSQYMIRVDAVNGEVIVPQFTAAINYANGAVQYLDQLAPVAAIPAATPPFMPLPGGSPASGYVPVATGAGQASLWTNAGVRLQPSGDTTGAADTAAVNAVCQAGRAALLSNGTWYVTHLLPDSFGVIAGQGPGTILQAVAGTTGYMIALKTPASTQQVAIADLTLKPNTGSLGGIGLDNTGFSGTADSLHTVNNVHVQGAGGDAFNFGVGVRELRVSRCKAYGSGGHGFYVWSGTTDSHFTDCTSGVSGNHGWEILGYNNGFVGCKAFWSGFNGTTWGTTQAGFYLNTCQACHLVGCEAQQSANHGFDLQSCTYCTVCGCDSDTNGAGINTGCGINTNGAAHCSVVGNTGANNAGLSPGAQKYGLQVAGSQAGAWFACNTVSGSSGTFGYVSGGGYAIIDSGVTDFSGLPVPVGMPSVDIKTAGAGLMVAEGSNCKQGTATLNGVTSVVVSNTAVTANSRIFLTIQAPGGTVGSPYVFARSAGTSFTIRSTVAGDTSTVAYLITEPG